MPHNLPSIQKIDEIREKERKKKKKKKKKKRNNKTLKAKVPLSADRSNVIPLLQFFSYVQSKTSNTVNKQDSYYVQEEL